MYLTNNDNSNKIIHKKVNNKSIFSMTNFSN